MKTNTEDTMSFPTKVSNELYVTEFLQWLQKKGFVDDRSWHSNGTRIDKFYSLVKGKYRFEIHLNWNEVYSSYKPLIINFIDCSNEIYPGGCIHMYLGQKHLLRFENPISFSFFEGICEQYEIN